MKQKLIALDLDGTTLNDQSKITEKTKHVLRTLDEQGHIISIVTGRPYRLTKDIYNELGIRKPIINFNGSTGMIPDENWNGSYEYTVNRDIVLDLLNHQKELGIKLMAAERINSILGSKNAPTDYAKATVGFFPDNLKADQILSKQTLKNNPIEAAINFDPTQFEKLKQYVEEQYNGTVALSVWGGNHNVVELTKKGITKATGIKALINYYQIPLADTIAFGDQLNDKPNLTCVGHAVAMKNAIPEIKQIADDITKFDNNHDGVANYLEEYFKLN